MIRQSIFAIVLTIALVCVGFPVMVVEDDTIEKWDRVVTAYGFQRIPASSLPKDMAAKSSRGRSALGIGAPSLGQNLDC